jgi:hypothetical protein
MVPPLPVEMTGSVMQVLVYFVAAIGAAISFMLSVRA